jgi:chromosome segregation ATPase
LFYVNLTFSGLIEGYSSERESLDERIRELEEDKETLVLELETTKNKLLDLESIQTENSQLKKEMEEQRELMTHNVGEEAQGFNRYQYVIVPIGVAIGCLFLHDLFSR